jgi:hypothetical protein
MDSFLGVLVGLVLVLSILLMWRWPRVRQRLRGLRQERLAAQFQTQKESLQQEFLRIGAASGKPRGLRWESCGWGQDFFLARDRSCNGYVALMEVAIQFSAIPGGDMEDVEAVALAKNATALFFFETGQWHTGGKALFNLNPEEVLERYQAQYERLG